MIRDKIEGNEMNNCNDCCNDCCNFGKKCNVCCLLYPNPTDYENHYKNTEQEKMLNKKI